MLDSDESWREEDSIELKKYIHGDISPSQESVDFSTIRRIIVFTFAGCVPPMSDMG